MEVQLFMLLGLLLALLVLRMAADINYDRPKIVVINDTPINVTLFGAEQPTALAALAAGTTGIADIVVRADADESGGADVQDLFRITLTPQIVVATGELSLQVEVTPVNGDASDAPTVTSTVTHPETMDAWQTAAGRARQA